jgi:hypothetical protein
MNDSSEAPAASDRRTAHLISSNGVTGIVGERNFARYLKAVSLSSFTEGAGAFEAHEKPATACAVRALVVTVMAVVPDLLSVLPGGLFLAPRGGRQGEKRRIASIRLP